MIDPLHEADDMNFLYKNSLIWVIGFLIPLLMQSAFALSTRDKISVESSIHHYVSSWNEKSGRGFSDVFEEHADFVNIFGMRITGKSAIENRHIEILETFLKNSKLHVISIELKELTPQIVIAWVRWRLEGFRTPRSDQIQSGEIREGIFTQVFRKNENKWQIVTSQNTLSPKI